MCHRVFLAPVSESVPRAVASVVSSIVSAVETTLATARGTDSTLVDEYEFGRAEQDFDVTSPGGHWQERFLLIALAGAWRDAGHHPVRIHPRSVRHIRRFAWGSGLGLSLLGGHFFLFRLLLLQLLFSLLPLFILFLRLIPKVFEAELYFFRRRRAAEYEAIGFLYARRRGRFGFDPADHQFGLLLNKVAVHEKQALQRHVRRVTLLGGDDGAGKIEELKKVIQFVAAHFSIQGSPRRLRRQGLRRPSHFLVERPGSGE